MRFVGGCGAAATVLPKVPRRGWSCRRTLFTRQRSPPPGASQPFNGCPCRATSPGLVCGCPVSAPSRQDPSRAHRFVRGRPIRLSPRIVFGRFLAHPCRLPSFRVSRPGFHRCANAARTGNVPSARLTVAPSVAADLAQPPAVGRPDPDACSSPRSHIRSRSNRGHRRRRHRGRHPAGRDLTRRRYGTQPQPPPL